MRRGTMWLLGMLIVMEVDDDPSWNICMYDMDFYTQPFSRMAGYLWDAVFKNWTGQKWMKKTGRLYKTENKRTLSLQHSPQCAFAFGTGVFRRKSIAYAQLMAEFFFRKVGCINRIV
ncbi:uncharacterized protein LOC129738188 [Uranotaenia lowii]|uniref:uncharacterized protein LOC129738188 n=1 Tax=Uranotaenia lowii TaxID=190385 RepID=UPI002478B9D8|nr:uncharacterized protein LOC129738188 [Uranotaenia lowii]